MLTGCSLRKERTRRSRESRCLVERLEERTMLSASYGADAARVRRARFSVRTAAPDRTVRRFGRICSQHQQSFGNSIARRFASVDSYAAFGGFGSRRCSATFKSVRPCRLHSDRRRRIPIVRASYSSRVQRAESIAAIRRQTDGIDIPYADVCPRIPAETPIVSTAAAVDPSNA